MTIYILKDATTLENLSVFDEWTKAQDKGMEIFGGAENDFEIDIMDVK